MLTATTDQDRALRELAGSPPPSSALDMPRIASDAGVSIESIDAGGQHIFSRPEVGSAGGPIASSLGGRVQGSSEQVSSAARTITDGGALAQGLADTAATERRPDALPATVAGVDPKAPRRA